MMTTTAVDDYWSKEEFAGRLLFPPRDNERDVFFPWHESSERYGRNHRELGLTLADPGERDYVHVKACFYSPRIILTFDLTPPIQTDIGVQIGEVTDSRQKGQNRHDVANCQAWYYPNEKTLMLWEVDLYSSVSGEEDPTKDFLLSSLWVLFETRLLERFPDCERILTPHHEPRYDRAFFQTFLRERGYTPGPEKSGVFVKLREKGTTHQ
jgi:hypothetical protein